ncbi:maleylpyruvate isomerase family mycothiol-dependent enzyme [Streptomyces gobiensis]|uniref:maleylpyruvate isomerase family mycothiol-dependent enzyme n=1 Tax=Streptomyces gobiensis TaxID=2875706 RepID=UPI001E30C592|nr:maleylpyruvate isomerase family mycothiol-dependent enzyme [Streptomyces gobiensis]UGY94716.1 maleylpyruvate isomerase family mycothiol-dependent enzyme [Streptomyces gobiensis]
METADFITALSREGQSLIAAAEEAGFDAEVPSCPDWQVRDLVRHQGLVHRWATRFVVERLMEAAPFGEETVPDEELGAWFRDGHQRLVDRLTAAPEDLRCWTFLHGSPSPRTFWARRQTHETTLHRIDAELAEGQALSPVDPIVAADGIDELLVGFHTRKRSRVRSERPQVLRVRATDMGAEQTWTVRITTEPPEVTRGAGEPADCEISGPAEVLYLALWNRMPYESGLTTEGDPALAELWRTTSAI